MLHYAYMHFDAAPIRSTEKREEEKRLSTNDFRDLLLYRIDRLKGEQSKLDKTGVQYRSHKKTIEKFQRMNDLLVRMDVAESDEISSMLDKAIVEVDKALHDAQQDHFQTHLIQRTDDLLALKQYIESTSTNTTRLAPYQEWKARQSRTVVHPFADYRKFMVEHKTHAAEDEVSAYHRARVHDEITILVQPERRDDIVPFTVAEGLAHIINVYQERKNAAAQAKGASRDFCDRRFAGIAAPTERILNSVFPEIKTHPSARQELLEIRLSIFSADGFIADTSVRDAVEALRLRIDSLAWNDVKKGAEELNGLEQHIVGSMAKAEAIVSEQMTRYGPDSTEARRAKNHLVQYVQAYVRVLKLNAEFARRKKWQLVPDEPPIDDSKFQAEEAKGKAWVNIARERVYHRILDESRSWQESGKSGGEYIRDVILQGSAREDMLQRCREILTPEVMQKIRVVSVVSTSLSKLAGREIIRPVVLVDSEEAYVQLERVFIGERAGGSHGIHLSGYVSKHPLWGKVGLVISKSWQKGTITHEMRHSVDPFISRGVESRTGYNDVLSELFAEYIAIIDADKTVTNTHDPRYQNVWRAYKEQVEHRSYWEQYSRSLPERDRVSYETWRQLVSDCVDHVAGLSNRYGSDSVQEFIAQSTTVEQFLATGL